MSMSARYAYGGQPQEKMDILIEQVARLTQSVERLWQQRRMEVTIPEEVYEDVNYVHSRSKGWSYNDYQPNQGGGNYNQYDNLSYRNPNNELQPLPGFTISSGMVSEPQKKSTEELLNAFIASSHKNMEHSNQRLLKIEDDVQSLIVRMQNLSTKISQISQVLGVQNQRDQFPEQTTVNPNECKSIYVRSEQNSEDTYMPEEKGK